jgi:hypothetical protein
MGYDLHITRKENWSDDDDSAEISLQEWQSYVQSDGEMEMESTAAGMTRNDEVVEFESEGLAFWRNYSRHGIDGNKAWFLFHNGEIVVKNPDVEIRNKMIAIATSLKAKVQGDEGEIYREIEVVQTKKWWKIW